MSSLTHKLSKLVFAAAIPVVTLALFLVVFGASVFVINTATNTVTAADDQVAFTVEGTAVITSVTKLPGGLLQLDGTTKGKATHLGDVSGPVTRIQDHQGNFNSTFVLIGANEKDTVFLTTSGRFETSKDKCLITSTGTYTVTGGTGAFANATGSGTISTETNLCTGTALGTFTGTISRPNSN